MQDFIAMGGYGAYVWPSYALSAVVLAGLLLVSLSGLKSTQSEFDRLKRAADGQKQKQETETSNGDEA